MRYELYKKVYALSKEEKEYLLSKFDKITSIVKEKPHAENCNFKGDIKYPDQDRGKNDVVRNASVKTASGAHDPETVDEMNKLIELFEKHLQSNRDLSIDNISIFLNPLHRGAKKYALRPYRIVGLVRQLEKLSRAYQKQKSMKKESLLYQTERDFKKIVENIKDKIKTEFRKEAGFYGFGEETVLAPKIKENVDNFLKDGWTIEEVIEWAKSNINEESLLDLEKYLNA